jgi:phospholipase C
MRLSLAEAVQYENGLPSDYYQYLTTGATDLTAKTPDTRITYDGQLVTNLPPGPFQLTGPNLTYDDYAASPVHRFYQMWQQLYCNAVIGCLNDLFPWVEVTVGAGTNGKPPPVDFNEATTGEGGTAMAFYNVQQGDAPYFKSLADEYSMSDNFHQSVMGGTGANHIMLGYGDAIWFSDPNGNPAKPPHNEMVAVGSPNEGTVDEIENPNPQPNTNNYYIQDGVWRRFFRFGLLRRRQLHNVFRHRSARGPLDRRLSAVAAPAGEPEMRTAALLPPQ